MERGMNPQRVSKPQPSPLAVVEVVRDDARRGRVPLRHPPYPAEPRATVADTAGVETAATLPFVCKLFDIAK